jgi:hypothetical protein
MQRTIKKVELYVQCLGAPESWLGPTNPLGFPGIPVPQPDVLQLCTARLVGRTVNLPEIGAEPSAAERELYTRGARDSLRKLFDEAVGKEGPGADRWALGAHATSTVWNKIIWVWDTTALAVPLCTQRLTPSGELDPKAPIEPYAPAYDVPTSDGGTTRVVARFQLLFVFA